MPSKSKNASAASKEAKQLEKLQAELERKKAKLDALMKSGAARANAQPARPSPRVADISSVFRGISSRASRARSPRNVASSAVSARRRRLDRSIDRSIDRFPLPGDRRLAAGRPTSDALLARSRPHPVRSPLPQAPPKPKPKPKPKPSAKAASGGAEGTFNFDANTAARRPVSGGGGGDANGSLGASAQAGPAAPGSPSNGGRELRVNSFSFDPEDDPVVCKVVQARSLLRRSPYSTTASAR